MAMPMIPCHSGISGRDGRRRIAGDLTLSPAGLLSGKISADSDNLKPLGALAG